jgi:CopA family copper-resistance protein
MKRVIYAILFLASLDTVAQKVVRYDLYVRDTTVTFGKKPKRAIAVNGQIPMPTLTFTEGDTAEIWVYNELDEETSLHWHGLFLPNRYDGVPNMTQMPIKPHTKFLYRFPIKQHGTHWYHSHTELQEQIGMYGSFVMNKRADDKTIRKGIDDIPTLPIVFSEWTDYNPKNVHRMLHNASDWFAIKKGTTQSYSEAIHQGYFKTKVKNEWKRMNAMDVSDVYYDAFLLNGKRETSLGHLNDHQLKAGDKVRLRIANGGASTYFWLTWAGGKMSVVATDGNDVEPVEVDRLIVGVSETYDVVLTLPPDGKAYEFRATSEDRIGHSSLYLGKGEKVAARPLPKLKYFEGMKMMNGMMKMNGDLDDMGMNMSLNQMDMNVVMYPEITGGEEEKKPEVSPHSGHEGMGDMKMGGDQYNSNQLSDIVTLNYGMLKATESTALPRKAPIKTLNFTLSGNMNRYVWSIDNKVVSEADRILIRKGEIVRMIVHNNSMMRHPMHLHGHDFRVLNGQGEHAPLKNIIDIMPMETDTLEFLANEPGGDWFFHCHILYHMMAGMGRVFRYDNALPNPEITNPRKAQRKLFADDRKFHLMAENSLETNGNDGEIMISNTRWSIGSEWRLGYHDFHGYEVENHIGRYIGKMQWFMPFIGYDWRFRTKGINFQERNIFGQTDTKDTRKAFSLGFMYVLPMLVQLEAEAFTDGTFLVQLKRMDIPVTKRLRMNLILNSDKEYMAGLKYVVTKNLGISSHYDSDMGWGIGLTGNY